MAFFIFHVASVGMEVSEIIFAWNEANKRLVLMLVTSCWCRSVQCLFLSARAATRRFRLAD